MGFKRCEGVVLHGRDEGGNRAGLVPPRRCWKVALKGGEYCEVHRPAAEHQDLLRQLFRPGWERLVDRWEREKQRQQERERLDAKVRERLGLA